MQYKFNLLILVNKLNLTHIRIEIKTKNYSDIYNFLSNLNKNIIYLLII